MARNQSEAFVEWICRNCFLSMWSYANPLGKGGKELCDTLVVCDPHVIVVSVKEVEFDGSRDYGIASRRWIKKAIDASIAQIDGACRWLDTASYVVRSDGEKGIALPPIERRKVHRIAVALGGDSQVPIEFGQSKSGYVHVFTEDALRFTMRELDTITDLTDYLTTVETWPGALLVNGSEADLTATYLSLGRKLPYEPDLMIIENDCWEGYEKRPERLRKVEEDQVSYMWDRLIEEMNKDYVGVQGLRGSDLDGPEKIVRMMAREDRFNRRRLADTFLEFHRNAAARKIRARMVQSDSGVGYVFMYGEHGGDRMELLPELTARTFLALGILKSPVAVVGILMERDIRDGTISFITHYRPGGSWTDKDQQDFEKLQKETGWWASPKLTRKHFDEYPPEPVATG